MMKNPLELAQGFHARRYVDFTGALMEDSPLWIMLGNKPAAEDAEPWQNVDHRMWFCLLVHGAEEAGVKPL